MKMRIFGVSVALVLALSLFLVAVPAAAYDISSYEIIISPAMAFGDGGWGGWSVPAGKVVLCGGFVATAPVAASAPGTPNSVWPHYTYGPGEYGWVVRDAIDGVGNTITIYAVCADAPAGYGVAQSAVLNYGDGGWAGWSVPAGKVVMGGGFVLSNPVAASAGPAAACAPAKPNSVWPHYTYGASEYGWVVRDAPDGVGNPGSYVYAIYADEPAGYVISEPVEPVNLDDGMGFGLYDPLGPVILGGGFVLGGGGPAVVSKPYSPYPDMYGWFVGDAQDGIDNPDSYIYAIFANQQPAPPAVGGEVYPINKITVLAPVLVAALAVAIAAVIATRRFLFKRNT